MRSVEVRLPASEHQEKSSAGAKALFQNFTRRGEDEDRYGAGNPLL